MGKLKLLGLFIFLISSFAVKLHSLEDLNAYYKALVTPKLSDSKSDKQATFMFLDKSIKKYEQDSKKMDMFSRQEFGPKIAEMTVLRDQLAGELEINLNNSASSSSAQLSNGSLSEFYGSGQAASSSVAVRVEEEVEELDISNALRVPHGSLQNGTIINSANGFDLLNSRYQELVAANNKVNSLKSEIAQLNLENRVLKGALAGLATYNVLRFTYNTLQNNPKLAFVVKAASLGIVGFSVYKYAEKNKWFKSEE